MRIVNVREAKSQLSRLLARAEAGEDVVIARRGEPVARLVACKPKGKRRFGAMKGKIVVGDSILDPLPEAELALWEGGTDPKARQPATGTANRRGRNDDRPTADAPQSPSAGRDGRGPTGRGRTR